jgi:D-threo-aldose 1-dehydrogenase
MVTTPNDDPSTPKMPGLPVGQTSLRVPVLGLGGSPLSGSPHSGSPHSGLYAPVPEEQALAAVRFALASGVNFFDTAPMYGMGLSEARIGLGLAGTPRTQFVLATKIGKILSPEGGINADYSRDGVQVSLDASLKRLRLEQVDILHIHDADADEHFRTALDEAFPALADLRSQGVIRAIGAGMNQWQRLSQFLAHADFDCFLLAGRYTLLEQASLDFLNTCAARQVRVFLGGVYNTGILATGAIPGARYNYREAPQEILQRVRKIEQVCSIYNVPLQAAALQFPLAHPAVSLIVGMQSPQEIAENTSFLRHPIPAGFWRALQDAGLLLSNAPLPV